MAAVNFERVTQGPNNESFNELFTPNHTLDQPCDVVLVVEDGKQFKAHRKVLSEASPFFEKLLSSDMKESKEGIVRLEMFSESVMAATLEFIYTGHVKILSEDNARDLIVVADYLLLQKLQILAEGVLAQKLNLSNCISIYYFSERYQCEDLFSKSKKFILANFKAVFAANREDVLKMSSKEVEMLISSDEIDVSAEEEVFNFILSWIDHDKGRRKEYFAELFCQFRLVYVSRDFLSSDVVTNDLVKDNQDCLRIVKDAINSVDTKNYDNLSLRRRKSLEAPAIVVRKGADFLCYFPGEDNWCRLGEIPPKYSTQFDKLFPCKGKLYGHSTGIVTLPSQCLLSVSYNPYTDSWMQLPPLEEDKCVFKMFVTNEDEMYALLSDRCSFCLNCSFPCGGAKKHNMSISKYKPESHSWEDILDHLFPYVRRGFCIVASEHFIYFIGGWMSHNVYQSDVDRYDLSKGQWGKVADIQVARSEAEAAAGNGKVFIAGGNYQGKQPLCDSPCEMYDETTNEWQLIASFKKPEAIFHRLLATDGKLYAVSCETPSLAAESDLRQITVECYDPEKNEWEMKTEKAFPVSGFGFTTCATRIFKGLSNICPIETNPHASAGKLKCFIM